MTALHEPVGALVGDGTRHPVSMPVGYRDVPHFLPDIGYVVRRECIPTWRIEEGTTTYVDLTYVLRGRAHYIIDGSHYDVRAGDLVCVPLGSRRSATTVPTDPMSCFAVDFMLPDRRGNPVDLRLPRVHHAGLHTDVAARFDELWTTWTSKEHGYATRANGLMLLLLGEVIDLVSRETLAETDAGPHDPRITQAARYLTDHLREDINIGALAASFGLSTVYFTSLFRQQNGISPRQYLTQVRIRRAQDLLSTGGYTVRDVARLCGYSDVLYFRRHFKEVTGLRPSEFLR